MRRVEHLYLLQDGYRERLKNKMPEVRETVSGLFRRICQKIKEAPIPAEIR
jgi:hypothetical protein